MNLGAIINPFKEAISKWYIDDGDQIEDIPSESAKEEDKVSFVKKLYKDSVEWRKQSLQNRFVNQLTVYSDPVDMWRDARKLSNGNHWDVWGHRNTVKGQEWMHELVWSAIEDQKRIRKVYLTSNVHEFDIKPNINYVSDLVRQNMMKSKWNDCMNELVDRALTDGTSFAMEIMDKNLDPDGVSRTIVVDPASILPTPNVTMIDRTEGCWYTLYATVQNAQQVLSQWGDKIEKKDLTLITEDQYKEISTSTLFQKFSQAKLVSVVTLFLDDDKIIPVPFDEEEFLLRRQAILDGQPVQAREGDNHRKYIKKYIEYLDEYGSALNNPTPEDEQMFGELVRRVTEVAQQHEAFLEQDPNADKMKKYPFGRQITVVGDKVVEDIPNPYEIDWQRRIFKYDMEKVPGSFWGRGIPEIMWNTNKMMDVFLSRVADMTVYSLPQKWLNIQDKETLAQQGVTFTNDPTQIQWYDKVQPFVAQGSMPGEFVVLLQKMQEGLDNKIGVNKVTTGQAPNSRASGDLVETLIQQNTILITGEADQNLLEVVTNIIETKIEMMRVLYTEPRQFIINGAPVTLVPSDVLTQYQGKPIQEFEVFVKPQSNYPNRWETDLAFALQMMQTVGPDGTPLVPQEFVYEILGQKYPDLGVGGKFYQLSQATKIGLQVLQQQKIEAERQEKLKQKAINRVDTQTLDQLDMQKQMEKQNGTSQEAA